MSPAGSSESRGTMTVEQLIGECFVKTAQTVLSSRVHEPQTAASRERSAKRSAWFKLEIQEFDSAREALDRCRAERGVGLPLVLEIYLHPNGMAAEGAPGTLLERWTLRYSPGGGGGGGGGGAALPLAVGGLSRSQMARFNPQAVYKRLTLLVRAVYTYCRVLPAYRLARAAAAAERSPPFRLAYRLHSTLPPPDPGPATAPRTLRYEFAPVETAEGLLAAAVDYSTPSSVRVMGEAAAAVRMPRPTIIQDYVRGGAWGGGAERGAGAAIPAAASLPKELETLSTTPRRRGWSSSFRLSPARSYEPPSMVPSPRAAASPRGLAAAGGGGGAGSSGASTPRSDGQASSSLPRSASTPARGLGGRTRPPLPPTAPTAAARAFEPGGHPRPGTSPGAGCYAEYRVHEGEEGEDEEEEGEGGAGAASLSGRRISPPVKIPGASAAHRRRPAGLRSSGDLGALRDADDGGSAAAAAAARRATKPLSAPAVSHMALAASLEHAAAADGKAAATAAAAAAAADGGPPLVPPTPLGADPGGPSPLLLNPPSFTESAASSSGYPTSCSPDLPFAFTPTARYSCSPASAAGGAPSLLHRPSPTLTAGSSGPPSPRLAALAGGPPPSPPPSIRGREIPAGTALMRRASWGGRSASGAAGEGPWAPGAVGYSVSPLQDVGVLDSVLSASTPRHLLRQGSGLARRLTHAASAASGLAGSGAGAGPRRDPLMLTYHAAEGGARGGGGSPAGAPTPTPLPREESEQLPFDFAADGPEQGEGLHSGERPSPGQSPRAPGSPAGGGGGAAFAAVSSAAAVGAFVRLVREAPPLVGLGPVPLETGIDRLAALRARLAAPPPAVAGGPTKT